MKKLLSLLLIICSIGVAYADDKSTVTSLKYVTDELNTRQDKFGANDGKAMTFTNVAGGNLPRDVKASLGTSTTDSGLPTVSAVNTGIATKQDEIGAANTNTVVTYTGTPGTLGQKGIYQDSGTYATQSDNLIKASTFNAALRNGLENEFVCADRDPVSNQCWLWTIHNEENVGKNLFNQALFNTDVANTITYTTFEIPNGTYTMSTNFPYTGGATNVFVFAGEVTSGASTPNNGVYNGQDRTITVLDGKYTVAYRSRTTDASINTNNPKDYDFQLELGSTATEYEPYNSNSIQVPGKNLLNLNAPGVIYGNFINNNGIVTHDNTSTISDFIPCTEGTYYTAQTVARASGSNLRIHGYDENKNWVQMLAKSPASVGVITTATCQIPAEIKYIKVCGYMRGSVGEDAMLEFGSTATPYEPYTEETVNVYIPQNQSAQNP